MYHIPTETFNSRMRIPHWLKFILYNSDFLLKY